MLNYLQEFIDFFIFRQIQKLFYLCAPIIVILVVDGSVLLAISD